MKYEITNDSETIVKFRDLPVGSFYCRLTNDRHALEANKRLQQPQLKTDKESSYLLERKITVKIFNQNFEVIPLEQVEPIKLKRPD